MSVEEIKRYSKNAKLYKITLPADGSWTEPIDVFGFNELIPLYADYTLGDENFSANSQVNATESPNSWGAYEELTHALTFYPNDGFLPSIVEQGIATGHLKFRAPYIRFKASDAPSRGKSFHLYCL